LIKASFSNIGGKIMKKSIKKKSAPKASQSEATLDQSNLELALTLKPRGVDLSAVELLSSEVIKHSAVQKLLKKKRNCLLSCILN
jgi:hypothetical protein